MVRFFHTRFFPDSRKVSAAVLAFALITGYGLGSFLAAGAAHSTVSLMRTAISSRVSIVCLLPVVFLPFLFAAFAVSIHQLWLFIPLAFSRAAAFGYLASLVLYSFGSSGWLVFTLFLFSDCISLPLLCWFWLRSISKDGRNIYRDLLIVSGMLFGIVSLDCKVISPFLVSLLL